ncbi:MAG: GGDEF domain-containing protein [Pseudomonadota bacterium]
MNPESSDHRVAWEAPAFANDILAFWRPRGTLSRAEREELLRAQVAATRPVISGVLCGGAVLLALVGALEALGWVPGIGYPGWAVLLAALATGAGALLMGRLRDWRARLPIMLACIAVLGVFLSLPPPGASAPLTLRAGLFHLLPIALLALMARRTALACTVALVLALALLRAHWHGAPGGGPALYWLYVLTTLAFGLLLGGYRVAFAVQVYRARSRLREQAITDALTGLLNRAGWNREAPARHAEAVRDGRGLSVAFLDVDRFKSINDRHGHEAGDRVLQTLGTLLRGREILPGTCARLGGEEFVLLAIDTPPVEFEAGIERLRARFRDAVLPLQATLSAGIAHHRPGETLAAQLRRADAALYRAKAARRDRALVSD